MRTEERDGRHDERARDGQSGSGVRRVPVVDSPSGDRRLNLGTNGAMHRLPRSLCLAITFLASAGSHGQAQVRSAAPAWSTEYVTSPEASRPARISITVFDPVRQELASSPARTLLGSTVGALAFGTFATANSFGSGDGTYLLPAAVAAGAGLGAVLGSAFSGREPAPLQTIVGAALGGLPLLVISGADGSGSALLLGMVFPVVGASLGNAFGQ